MCERQRRKDREEISPHPAAVAFTSAYQSPVKQSHCTINAPVGSIASVGQAMMMGVAPRINLRYP